MACGYFEQILHPGLEYPLISLAVCFFFCIRKQIRKSVNMSIWHAFVLASLYVYVLEVFSFSNALKNLCLSNHFL